MVKPHRANTISELHIFRGIQSKHKQLKRNLNLHSLIVRNDTGVVTFEHVHKTKMQFWEGCWQLGFSMKKKTQKTKEIKII